MSIFQRAFRQNKTNTVQTTSDGVASDTTVSEDIENDGLKWISEYHVACVFLLDTSNSMNINNAIGKLNEGIKTFKDQTVDEHTKACIDVALVSFGPDVKVHQGFKPVSEMITPTLTAGGNTPMGAAINKALDMVTEQKKKYTKYGTPYFRPWVFCITDGAPNDSYAAAVQRLKQMEAEKRVLGYCVGVENFDRNVMAGIFDTARIFELDHLNFSALFKFVSNSLVAVRNSDPNGSAAMEVEAPKDLHSLTVYR